MFGIFYVRVLCNLSSNFCQLIEKKGRSFIHIWETKEVKVICEEIQIQSTNCLEKV